MKYSDELWTFLEIQNIVKKEPTAANEPLAQVLAWLENEIINNPLWWNGAYKVIIIIIGYDKFLKKRTGS